MSVIILERLFSLTYRLLSPSLDAPVLCPGSSPSRPPFLSSVLSSSSKSVVHICSLSWSSPSLFWSPTNSTRRLIAQGCSETQEDRCWLKMEVFIHRASLVTLSARIYIKTLCLSPDERHSPGSTFSTPPSCGSTYCSSPWRSP